MDVQLTKEEKIFFTNKLFLNAVLPVLKTVVEETPKLKAKFEGKTAVYQVSCDTEDGQDGTHYIVTDGVWEVKKGIYQDGPIKMDLHFKNRNHLNNFFKNKLFPLPKGMLKDLGFLGALMGMGGVLGAKTAPKDEATAKLLVKCMFYLLPAGISTLNKLGYAPVKEWASKSPDRVYAWQVTGFDDLQSHLRVKAGNTKASHGEYTRSMPFFTMQFDNVISALGILQSTDDMIDATIKGRLTMVGAPEFGAQIGDFMMAVGGFIQ